MRFRSVFMLLGGLAVLGLLFFTDPLGGSVTAEWALRSARFILYVGLVFLGLRALTDYRSASSEMLHEAAKQSPTGAGLALVHRALLVLALAVLAATSAFAQPVRTYIPVQAPEHLPALSSAINQHWPALPQRHLLAGQIEKESCISLTHSRCWNATSRLKTAREEGAGLAQITRAWHTTGARAGQLRFDALQELKDKHPGLLGGLNWSNVYQRPDLQLLVVVLKNRDNALRFSGVAPDQHSHFWLTSYNRGVGGVQAEMRACQLQTGCDPRRWVGHVERTCTASRQPLYAGRSACDISRAYAPDIINVRAPKYRGML